jgi:hypothetical protein
MICMIWLAFFGGGQEHTDTQRIQMAWRSGRETFDSTIPIGDGIE